jgi:hypothetical protein
MRWRNTSTPTFPGAGGTKPAVVETFDAVDDAENVVASLTKSVDGSIAFSVVGGAKVYRALLTQSGTAAPTAHVLENSLGGTLVWSYVDVGVYHGTLAGAFPDANKVFSPPLAFFSPDLTNAVFMRIDQADANTVATTCVDVSGDIDEMGASLIAVEILVYP